MEKTSSEILFDAADLLEGEAKWGQGAFFKLAEPDASNDACIMCAHGAIGFCGNPKIREKIRARQSSAGNICTVERENAQSTNAAHRYANQVGLTFEFNDKPGRTKQEVIDKLREAARRAAADSAKLS